VFVLVSTSECVPPAAKIMMLPIFFTPKTSMLQKSTINYVLFTAKMYMRELLKQWCRMFKDGQTNAHDKEPSVMSDDLIQRVDQKNCGRWRLTF
jgi:hypothetical protein